MTYYEVIGMDFDEDYPSIYYVFEETKDKALTTFKKEVGKEVVNVYGPNKVHEGKIIGEYYQ